MKNIEEVVHYIEDEISKAADAECSSVLAEVNEAKAKAEQELYKEAKRDTQLQLAAQLAEIEADAAIEISKSNSETTKKLIAKREEYTEKVFKEALAQLNAFTASKDYESFMIKKVEKAASICALDGSVFLIRKQDERYAALIKKTYGHECEVKIEPAIQLGGFIFENQSSHAIYDETLDAAFKDQHEWFANHSGLIIQ